jgi:hypothetical protein
MVSVENSGSKSVAPDARTLAAQLERFVETARQVPVAPKVEHMKGGFQIQVLATPNPPPSSLLRESVFAECIGKLSEADRAELSRILKLLIGQFSLPPRGS